jgi:uncharacterized protein
MKIPFIYKPIYIRNYYHYTILLNPYSYKGLLVIDKRIFSSIKQVVNGRRNVEKCLKLLKNKLPNLNSQELSHIFKSLLDYDIINYESSDNILKRKTDRENQILFWIDLTNQCNFRCSYCYVDKKKEQVNISRFSKFLDILQTLIRKYNLSKVEFILAGGEPLLYPKQLFGVIKKIKSFSQTSRTKTGIQLITNASLLTEDRANFLKKNKIRLGVSLDGLEAYHNLTRRFTDGTGTYKYVERGLKIAQKAGILANVIVTVSNKNISNLPALAFYLLKNKIRMRFQFFKKTNDLCNEDVVIPTQQVIKYYKKALCAIYKYYQDNNNLDTPLKDNSLLDRVTYPCNPSVYNCTSGINYFSLSPSGYIRACPSSGKEIPIFETDDFIRDLRAADKEFIRNNVENIPECKECLWKYICQGGCKMERLYLYKQLNTKSVKCLFFKKIIPYIIQLEAKRIVAKKVNAL